MRVDYDTLSHTYDDYRAGGGPYLRKLVELASEHRAAHVLEIGAGTGNNTQAFLAAHPCRLVGLDRSKGMLDRARGKGIAADWVQGDATQLPIGDGCVQFVFGVYVLHHLPDLDALFGECARVMRSGAAAFVTASWDFIDRHPMNAYFPSFARIDKARVQPIGVVEESLRNAGFAHVGVEHFVDVPRPIDANYVERIANKFISTYDLLPPEEFTQGLERLQADVVRKGRLDAPMQWESVVVWGEQ